jgi:hypothetical protein
MMLFEKSYFRALSIVQNFSLKTTFRKLALLRSSFKNWVGKGVAPTLWGPLEKASLEVGNIANTRASETQTFNCTYNIVQS